MGSEEENGRSHGPFKKAANLIVKRVERQASPRRCRCLIDLRRLCPGGDSAAQFRIGADEIERLFRMSVPANVFEASRMEALEARTERYLQEAERVRGAA